MPPRLRPVSLLAVFAACALLAGGCGEQSIFNTHSSAAGDIRTLWWWMLGISAVVFGGAVTLLAIGWVRRRRPGLPLIGPDEGLSYGLVIAFGMLIPLGVNLAVFVVANFVVAKATDAPDPSSTQMTIDVVGHQWFWEVRYPGTAAVTANEIHIPVGTRVNVVATADDVIHSFWVPSLNRKIDMIPGLANRVLLEADRAGRFRGQCAEFCGTQHAHMSMYVIAEPPDRFRAWLANQASAARTPTTAEERRGEQVFLQQACAGCHTIRGTGASGSVGPDLTHLQSRTTLAALTIPNRRGYLGGWILDPQHVKPGNRMPGIDLSGSDFNAVLAYLESLS